MIVYVDSSALIKRVVAEPESEALDPALAGHVADQDVLVSSSLAWVKVERALRSIVSSDPHFDVGQSARVAMLGVAERVIGADVVSPARRIEPPVLRTLDAIHLATALLPGRPDEHRHGSVVGLEGPDVVSECMQHVVLGTPCLRALASTSTSNRRDYRTLVNMC